MRAVIIRSCLENSSPRMIKSAGVLHEMGYEVSFLVWDRQRQKKAYEKHIEYDIYRWQKKAPFGLMILFYLPLWWVKIFWWLMLQRWDIVTGIDFDTIIPVLIAAKIKRKPVVYEMADTYEDMIPLPSMMRTFLIALDKVCMWLADAVIIVDEARYEEFNGIPNRNTVVIYNTPPDMADSYEFAKDIDQFIIFYAGAAWKRRGCDLDIIYHAIKDMENVKMIVAGYGDMIDDVKVWAEQDPSKVKFLGFIPYEEVLKRTRKADLVVALYNPKNLNNKYTSALKLFEAMMSGVPILVRDETATARLVNKEKCGIVIEKSDVETVKRAILHLVANPEIKKALGLNGRIAYEREYNWSEMSIRLKRLYEGMRKRGAQ